MSIYKRNITPQTYLRKVFTFMVPFSKVKYFNVNRPNKQERVELWVFKNNSDTKYKVFRSLEVQRGKRRGSFI